MRDVRLHGSPSTVEELNDLPVKTVGETPIYVRDVGHVRRPERDVAGEV